MVNDDLTTRVAKQIAFHGRNIHDVSKDAEDFWENTGTESRDIAMIQARAVVALVLEAAIDAVHEECWTDGDGRPATDALLAEQATTALAIRAIRALGVE